MSLEKHKNRKPHINVGILGHIDHSKHSISKAITGIMKSDETKGKVKHVLVCGTDTHVLKKISEQFSAISSMSQEHLSCMVLIGDPFEKTPLLGLVKDIKDTVLLDNLSDIKNPIILTDSLDVAEMIVDDKSDPLLMVDNHRNFIDSISLTLSKDEDEYDHSVIMRNHNKPYPPKKRRGRKGRRSWE